MSASPQPQHATDRDAAARTPAAPPAGGAAATARVLTTGSSAAAAAAVPTFTNPNNTAIICGAPPAVTGISGNFYLTEEGEAVMMNDAALVRCPSVLAAAGEAGATVLVVTAKAKLLRILGNGVPAQRLAALAVETAASDEADATVAAQGWPASTVDELMRPVDGYDVAAPPGIYDPEASVYCLELGHRMLQHAVAARPARPVLAYLSTTDYVQHKHAPDDPAALAFYARVDAALARLHATGATVVVTADHGMRSKADSSGAPRVLYVDDVLASVGVRGRTILPITDPYVVHHGALGGYATVYLEHAARDAETVAAALLRHPAVHHVLPRTEAAARFELPPDRIGDLVVTATADWALGRSPDAHDLSGVSHLRSHGSLFEQDVPLVVNRALDGDRARALSSGGARNFDAWSFALG